MTGATFLRPGRRFAVVVEREGRDRMVLMVMVIHVKAELWTVVCSCLDGLSFEIQAVGKSTLKMKDTGTDSPRY